MGNQPTTIKTGEEVVINLHYMMVRYLCGALLCPVASTVTIGGFRGPDGF